MTPITEEQQAALDAAEVAVAAWKVVNEAGNVKREAAREVYDAAVKEAQCVYAEASNAIREESDPAWRAAFNAERALCAAFRVRVETDYRVGRYKCTIASMPRVVDGIAVVDVRHTVTGTRETVAITTLLKGKP